MHVLLAILCANIRKTSTEHTAFIAVLHYNDVTWPTQGPKSPADPVFIQPFYEAHVHQNKRKSSEPLALWGESAGNRSIPLTKGQ